MEFKKTRKLRKTVEAILDRTDENDRLFYELRYFGATTGRWSGAGGLNMQNFHRKARWDVRGLLVPPKGYVLGIFDYSQIEARSLLWLIDDKEQLGLVKKFGDVYEAHARATMGYDNPLPLKKGNPELRHLAKARVLALGYGCGAGNFQNMAKRLCGLDLTEKECVATVADYRKTNWRIENHWKKRQAEARECIGGNYRVKLPSGRELFYYNVRRDGGGLVADVGNRTTRIYGGLMVENENQAFCRDILAAGWLRCLRAGYFPALSVHDELVFCLPEKTADRDFAIIKGLMEQCPAWCAGVPLGVEGELSYKYKK